MPAIADLHTGLLQISLLTVQGWLGFMSGFFVCCLPVVHEGVGLADLLLVLINSVKGVRSTAFGIRA